VLYHALHADKAPAHDNSAPAAGKLVLVAVPGSLLHLDILPAHEAAEFIWQFFHRAQTSNDWPDEVKTCGFTLLLVQSSTERSKCKDRPHETTIVHM
jgi:hypothetical protein